MLLYSFCFVILYKITLYSLFFVLFNVRSWKNSIYFFVILLNVVIGKWNKSGITKYNLYLCIWKIMPVYTYSLTHEANNVINQDVRFYINKMKNGIAEKHWNYQWIQVEIISICRFLSFIIMLPWRKLSSQVSWKMCLWDAMNKSKVIFLYLVIKISMFQNLIVLIFSIRYKTETMCQFRLFSFICLNLFKFIMLKSLRYHWLIAF